jgi:predicted nucleotidyltransferase
MSDDIKLPRDFADFIELLNKYNVRYVVVGSWAVGFHGRPRYTKDIDILIEREESNARQLLLVLQEFGFSSVGITEKDFLEPYYVIQLGYEPNRIDILTDIEGIDFKEAHNNAIHCIVDKQNVAILSLDDLIRVKRQAGRAQDIADIEALERILHTSSKA